MLLLELSILASYDDDGDDDEFKGGCGLICSKVYIFIDYFDGASITANDEKQVCVFVCVCVWIIYLVSR